MLVVYHHDCIDGLMAAWLMKQLAAGDQFDTHFKSAVYGSPVPEVHPGETVYIVDFSYPAQALVELCKVAGKVVVLDHHETAVNQINWYFMENPQPSNLELILDQAHSGTGLVWALLKPTTDIWGLPKHVEDHDLWNFNYPETKAVMQAIFQHPLTFESIDKLAEQPLSELIAVGTPLLNKQQTQIDWHIDNSLRIVEFEGYMVPLLNAPRYMCSVLGDYLGEKYPFVVIYHDDAKYRKYSLRSNKKTGVEVKAFAEKRGGGGHVNAAAFTVPLQPTDF